MTAKISDAINSFSSLPSAMSHSESNEQTRRALDEKNGSQQEGSVFRIFTGRTLQVVLIVVAATCFVSGYGFAHQLGKLRMASHALHSFYWHFKTTSLSLVGMGFTAFVWCVLDYFLIFPRLERQMNRERSITSQISNRLSILREDSSASLRRRVSQERSREDSETQSEHPTSSGRSTQLSSSSTSLSNPTETPIRRTYRKDKKANQDKVKPQNPLPPRQYQNILYDNI